MSYDTCTMQVIAGKQLEITQLEKACLLEDDVYQIYTRYTPVFTNIPDRYQVYTEGYHLLPMLAIVACQPQTK